MAGAEDLYSSFIVNCVFNGVLCYTAIMLNIITIHALRKTSSLPKPLKTLLMSLTVSDLSVGLLVQPLYIAVLVRVITQNSVSNPGLSSVLTITSNCLSYVSFFGIVALSADRCLAIHLHLRYQELVTHKRVVAAVISIWVISAFLSCIRFFVPVKKNSSVIFGTIDVACLVTTALFYCKIYLAVRRHINQIQALQVQPVAQNGEVTANAARVRKYAVDTLYVYFVFLACYLPNMCIFWDLVNSGYKPLTSHVAFYANTLVFLNSSLNPLIYCWKMRHIRHTMMNTLRNICPNLN